MLYRRDEEVRLLQDQLSTLLVDFHLLKGTFEHFTEDHWHPFQRSFFRSHPCTCWMGAAPSPLSSSPEEQSFAIPVPPPPSRSRHSSAISIPSLESVSSSDGGSDNEELQEEEGSEVSSKGQESTSCQGHSSLDSPSELNPPQRIPSPLFTTLLVPQAEG